MGNKKRERKEQWQSWKRREGRGRHTSWWTEEGCVSCVRMDCCVMRHRVPPASCVHKHVCPHQLPPFLLFLTPSTPHLHLFPLITFSLGVLWDICLFPCLHLIPAFPLTSLFPCHSVIPSPLLPCSLAPFYLNSLLSFSPSSVPPFFPPFLPYPSPSPPVSSSC